MSKSQIVKKNIVAAVILQLMTILNGFIVPRMILTNFGSEINGLISSINQFLSFITLLEGGLGAVVLAGLYKPLQSNDDGRISSVVKAASQFYRKIALIFLVYVLVLSVGFSIKYRYEFGIAEVCALVWVIAANLFVQYYFSVVYKLLIQADQKSFVVSYVQAITIALNTVVFVVLVRLSRNIVLVKASGAVIYLLQPILFSLYVKRHYRIDPSIEVDKDALSQRWDGFWHNIAYFIHSNTDVVILTLFASLKDVSVYTTYLLVINSLKTVVLLFSGAVGPTMGNTLARGVKEEIAYEFDFFEYGFFALTTFLFSAGVVLIVPFIGIYTRGVIDADYYQPTFAVVMFFAEAMFCLREPYVSVVNGAGHFRQTKQYAIIEAVINIVVSIVFVRMLGLVGVAIGTLSAMLYRTVMLIFYSGKVILKRSAVTGLKCIALSCLIIAFVYFVSTRFLLFSVSTYPQWILLAVVNSLFALITVIAVSMLIYRRQFISLMKNIFHKSRD